MKNLLTMLILLCSGMIISQTTYWSVYDFEVKPGQEDDVVTAFDRFFATETGKSLPSSALSASMFTNSETKFSHRLVFWSQDKKEFGKMYSGMLQQSTDMALLGMTLDQSIKPVASYLGKSLISEPVPGNNYRTLYELSVSDPATYAAAFSEMRTALIKKSGGRLGLDLHQFISGAEPGATHVVVTTAASMEELLEFTDMVFASAEFKKFAAKVKDIRKVQNIVTTFRAKMYNVEE
jgi:hypothetical protein